MFQCPGIALLTFPYLSHGSINAICFLLSFVILIERDYFNSKTASQVSNSECGEYFQNKTPTTENKNSIEELRANDNSDKCQWTQSN